MKTQVTDVDQIYTTDTLQRVYFGCRGGMSKTSGYVYKNAAECQYTQYLMNQQMGIDQTGIQSSTPE